MLIHSHPFRSSKSLPYRLWAHLFYHKGVWILQNVSWISQNMEKSGGWSLLNLCSSDLGKTWIRQLVEVVGTPHKISPLKKKIFYWSIVDLQCCVNFYCKAVTQLYICVCIYIYIYIYTHTHIFFFIFFPLCYITGYWIYFPVLYSRTLLFIYSTCNSSHLLTPNS